MLSNGILGANIMLMGSPDLVSLGLDPVLVCLSLSSSTPATSCVVFPRPFYLVSFSSPSGRPR